MTLITADPDLVNPIKVYPNGVRVIRLHEFLGPARGTLSVVSDPLSICGQVVKDEQIIAYSGSDPNKTIATNLNNSGLDAIRIHENDLNLDSNFTYTAYVSLRCEGTIDITKQNSSHNFLEIGSNAARIASYVRNSTLTITVLKGAGVALKPQINPYYKIRNLGTIGPNDFSEFDWYTIRGASGTGSIFAWFIDTLWLVPTSVAVGSIYSTGDFRKLLYDSRFEPVFNVKNSTYDASKDDFPLDWAGQYSVMILTPDGYMNGAGASSFADFQETENEKTLYEIYGITSSSEWLTDPPSDLTLVVGSHYTPNHQIDEDQFDRIVAQDLNAYLGESAENRAWRVVLNHPFQAAADSGYLIDGTQLKFKNGKYDLGLPEYFPDPPDSAPGSLGDPCVVQLGAFGTESGTGATSLGHQTLVGMNHCIMECMVTTDHILVAGFHMFAGFGTSNSDFIGVCLDIPSADVFGLRASSSINAVLMYYPSYSCERELLTTAHEIRLDEFELTTSFTPNTWIRIKVEMMWYRYRAKVWLDGDPEPSNWQLDTFIPMPFDSDIPSGTGQIYPWTTQSTIGANRRRRVGLFPTLGVRYFRPLEDTSGQSIIFSSNPTRLTSTFWKNLILNYEAYGSTPTDVHVRLKKYDDSIDFGESTIPYNAAKVIIAPLAQYTYNVDDNGFSVTLWKESGAPDTQAAVITDLWQKRRRGKDIGIYELVPLM